MTYKLFKNVFKIKDLESTDSTVNNPFKINNLETLEDPLRQKIGKKVFKINDLQRFL